MPTAGKKSITAASILLFDNNMNDDGGGRQRPARRRQRVLLGITGSVAAVKGPEIAVRIKKELRMDVRVLLTRGGENFWNKASAYDARHWNEFRQLAAQKKTKDDDDENDEEREERKEKNDELEEKIVVYRGDDEWKEWKKLSDPVLHIGLRDWADVVVVAPLSAHTLAKVSNGLCDDALSCVLRAWDFGHHRIRPGKPVILAPAMNTAMWDHPITTKQLETIRGFCNHDGKKTTGGGVTIVMPQEKTLACGEHGNGALASVDDIIGAVKRAVCE